MELKRIQEFSDNELVDELMVRYDDIIIGARKCLAKNPEKLQQAIERRRWWKGDYDSCVGLMMAAAIDCLHTNWGVNEEHINER